MNVLTPVLKSRHAAVLALLVGVALSGLLGSAPKRAAAQNTAVGTNEANLPFSGAVTLNAAPALVCTAVTGKVLNVRALTITNTASGVVQLYNGSGGAGSTVIASYGVIANTPLPLSEVQLRNGLRTSSGSGLYVGGATGTITLTASIRQD